MRELMTTENAAQFLGVKPNTLIKWRHQGTGPTFVKLGRSVRYEPDVLERWVKINRSR